VPCASTSCTTTDWRSPWPRNRSSRTPPTQPSRQRRLLERRLSWRRLSVATSFVATSFGTASFVAASFGAASFTAGVSARATDCPLWERLKTPDAKPTTANPAANPATNPAAVVGAANGG
jgi:hypothetical protein